jgi:hypothetical protein
MLPSERLAAVDALWVTDAELIRRLGVPEKIARRVIKAFDANPQLGFPQKSGLWGSRRYWPAVRAYLDRTNGLSIGGSTGRQANAR